MKQKILVIVGPTASGKSALAVALAKKFSAPGGSALGGNGAEIISADSRQVYRGLNIGTGKITKSEMKGVPHHLLDIASPKKIVTAYEFAQKARAAVSDAVARNSLPIVVGGTGFYIDAFLGRSSLPDVPPNKTLRTKLQKKTVTQLYALLKKRDPCRAKSMNTSSERNNKVRLIRALEVAAASKAMPSSQDTEDSPRYSAFALNRKKILIPAENTEGSPRYDVLWVGIATEQKDLERRIRLRLQARIKKGMVREARSLRAQGLSFKRMEELGLEYRSLSRLLQKKITKKEFEEELFRDIRRYAKKQLAYWRRNKDIRWYAPKDAKGIERAVLKWLKS